MLKADIVTLRSDLHEALAKSTQDQEKNFKAKTMYEADIATLKSDLQHA